MDNAYLLQELEIAPIPLSVTMHQLASTCVRLWHLAEACSKIQSPVKAPLLQPHKFNSWKSITIFHISNLNKSL